MTNAPATNARLRQAASGVSRRAGARAAIFLAVAVIAAVGTAVLLTRYMDARVGRARIETRKVVVAAAEQPIATALKPEALAVVDWPASTVPEGTFGDAAALSGRVLLVKLAKGEPILAAKLADKEAGNGLAAVLPADMRAVSVRVDDVVGVAGFIHPGDSVDVIVTMKPNERSDALPVSKLFLQNVRVLAVGKQLDVDAKQARKPVEATVATLMVDSEQAEMLALAATRGKLLLALRSTLDARVVPTPGVIPPTLLAGSPEEKASQEPSERRVTKAVRPAGPPKSGSEVVEILRGDRFEERAFKERGGK